MSPTNPTSLMPSQLEAALRAWASGLATSEAAVELLIRHGVWIRRPSFVAACVWADDEGHVPDSSATFAGIDWHAALTFAENANATERHMLMLACSLAGSLATPPLGLLIAGLDDRNVALVLQAIAHTAGWHEHGTALGVTGRFGGPL